MLAPDRSRVALGGVHPFVDGDLEVVHLGEVLDQGWVDRDSVTQHDFEVLNARAARNQGDVTHDDGGVELVFGVLLRPRGETDRQVRCPDSTLVVELLGFGPDGFGAATRVSEDFVVSNQAGQTGGSTSQKLR